jgi:MFS family permease
MIIAFGLRALTVFGFSFVTTPYSIFAYLWISLMSGASVFMFIAVEGIMFKNTEPELRGSLYNLYNMVGYLGSMLTIGISQWLYNVIGGITPFYIMMVGDVLVTIVVVIHFCHTRHKSQQKYVLEGLEEES